MILTFLYSVTDRVKLIPVHFGSASLSPDTSVSYLKNVSASLSAIMTITISAYKGSTPTLIVGLGKIVLMSLLKDLEADQNNDGGIN